MVDGEAENKNLTSMQFLIKPVFYSGVNVVPNSTLWG